MARRVLPEKSPELAPHGCPVDSTAMVPCRAAAPHTIRGLATGLRTFTEPRATVVEAGARLKSFEGEG